MPPKSYKKYQKSVNKRPRWLETMINDPQLGVVYNIYECFDSDCILPHNIDCERPGFKRMIEVPWRKKKSLEQCCAKHKSLLKIKYKKCNCGAEFWGTRLKSSDTCKFCGVNPDIDYHKTKVRYYRRGEYYKTLISDLTDPNRADCKYRDECLSQVLKKGGKTGMACRDCPYYSTIIGDPEI